MQVKVINKIGLYNSSFYSLKNQLIMESRHNKEEGAEKHNNNEPFEEDIEKFTKKKEIQNKILNKIIDKLNKKTDAMKKLNLFTIILLVAVVFSTSLKAQNNSAQLQQKCNSKTDITKMSGAKAMWDILNYFETTSSSQGGIATDGKFIYTSSFSTEMFRKFNMDGTFVEEFTIPDIEKINCLTYDGTNFYGANGPLEKGIVKLDFENKSLISTITVSAPSIIGIGHITYDPALDDGKGGFWIGYWHEMCAVDDDGDEIIANTVSTMPGIGGTALDNVTDPDNPALICFQQTGDSNLELTKFNINTKTFSDVLHVATDIPGPSGGSSNSVASGLNSYINNDGKLVLLGLIDCFPGNEMVFQYEVSNAIAYTNDISVNRLIAPVTGSSIGDSENVKVKLYNNGTVAQSNFDIQYTIITATGSTGPFTQTVTETINADSYLVVTFDDAADVSLPSVSYTFEIVSLLSGDENSKNDTLTKTITNTNGNYCEASGGSNSSSEHISNVTIGDMSNTSSADNYANYSGDPDLYIYLEPETESGNLTVTNGHPYNANMLAIWIDWNNDSDFTDAGEDIFVSELGQGPYVTTITPPSSALQNTILRMRIRLLYYASAADDPEPCGSKSFGEVEDYSVIVAGVQLNPPLNLQYTTAEGNINLTWDAPSEKALQSYNVYYSLNMGDFTVLQNIADATNFSTTIPEVGIHQYYVTGVYDDGESIPSNIVELIVSGISDNQKPNINIYPNPACGLLNIQAQDIIENIMVFDNSGKLVFNSDLNNKKFQINTNKFNKGFYIFKIRTKKATTYSRIIII